MGLLLNQKCQELWACLVSSENCLSIVLYCWSQSGLKSPQFNKSSRNLYTIMFLFVIQKQWRRNGGVGERRESSPPPLFFRSGGLSPEWLHQLSRLYLSLPITLSTSNKRSFLLSNDYIYSIIHIPTIFNDKMPIAY